MSLRSIVTIICTSGLALLSGMTLGGCDANAWMGDPGAIGYYKPTPTTIPILDRIDIIEEPANWPMLSKVTSEDLMPSDLTYRIAPGDVLDVAIYGLYVRGQFYPVQRRVDQSGYFRIPEVGDVPVAGLTAQGAQDLITKALTEKAMTHPSVQLDVLDQTGFTYTIYGGLARWGVFTLRDPNLLLVEALAQAGGVPQTTNNIYVIRSLPMNDTVLPSWDRERYDNGRQTKPLDTSYTPKPQIPVPTRPNIQDLLDQLEIGEPSVEGNEVPPVPTDLEAPMVPTDLEAPMTDPLDFFEPSEGEDTVPLEIIDPSEINEAPEGEDTEPPEGEVIASMTDGITPVSMGILQSGEHELIDIDDVIPTTRNTLPVDVDDIATPTQGDDEAIAAYIYVPESDTWVPVSADPAVRRIGNDDSVFGAESTSPMLERIIEIPWRRLRQGDSSLNIIVRPDDRIYVEPPDIGHLYIRGEVGRPGVYDFPVTGEKITLSQFITVAGDLGPIAVPEKVSLTRRIGANLEATVTLDFAAIMQRTEPDIFLKPNDHISIGTSWGATPLAIIRNGFRTTYGFGFLLDRNFGNDVFGVPPR